MPDSFCAQRVLPAKHPCQVFDDEQSTAPSIGEHVRLYAEAAELEAQVAALRMSLYEAQEMLLLTDAMLVLRNYQTWGTPLTQPGSRGPR